MRKLPTSSKVLVFHSFLLDLCFFCHLESIHTLTSKCTYHLFLTNLVSVYSLHSLRVSVGSTQVVFNFSMQISSKSFSLQQLSVNHSKVTFQRHTNTIYKVHVNVI